MSKRKASAPKTSKPWDLVGVSKSTYYRKRRKAKRLPMPRLTIGTATAAGPIRRKSDPLTRTSTEAQADYKARVLQSVTTVDVGAEIQKAVDAALVENFLSFISQIPADGRMVYATSRQAWAVARALRAAGIGGQTGTG